VEVRLSDGTVLTVFNSVHDVSHLALLPETRKTKAGASLLGPIRYINQGEVEARASNCRRNEC